MTEHEATLLRCKALAIAEQLPDDELARLLYWLELMQHDRTVAKCSA